MRGIYGTINKDIAKANKAMEKAEESLEKMREILDKVCYNEGLKDLKL